MSAILVWLLLLFGAELFSPAASATVPADTTTPTLTVLDGGGGIPPRTLP